jgi:hypothetical protein
LAIIDSSFSGEDADAMMFPVAASSKTALIDEEPMSKPIKFSDGMLYYLNNL